MMHEQRSNCDDVFTGMASRSMCVGVFTHKCNIATAKRVFLSYVLGH